MRKRTAKKQSRALGVNIRQSVFSRAKRFATANAVERVDPATMTAVVEQALEAFLNARKAPR
jgi:hypothetical protein